MNCTEFQDKLADLFDKEVDPKTFAQMKKHMETCPKCKALYEELVETTEELQPKHSPIATTQTPVIPMHKSSRTWLRYAASAAIFFVGLAIGASNFFSQDAKATTPFSFKEAINSVRNVGSYSLQLEVRTTPNENFAHFDPQADFIPVCMQKLTVDGKTYWRVEKQSGRTIVNNAFCQYMWIPNGTQYIGSLNSNFLEVYALFLEPTRLFNLQQIALQLGKDVQSKTQQTDSTVTITTSFEVEDTELSAIFNETSSTKVVTIQNTCTKADGLLRSLSVSIDWNGKQIEILRSTGIHYNLSLDKEELLSIPQEGEWIDLRNGIASISDQARLDILSHENAITAAQRILSALITGNTEEASEALIYYKKSLPGIHQDFSNCQVSEFSLRKDANYIGVLIFYNLTRPNGKKEIRHIALRNDNPQHIWILDGGI